MDRERQLHQQGYWRFTPAGMAIPGLFDAIDWSAREQRRFWQSHQVRFAQVPLPKQAVFLFAYEAEHRHTPIASMEAAYAALVRISACGYDTGPALAIKAAMEAASAQLQREATAAMQARQRASSERKCQAELASKHLPRGPAANLALMRAALKMPARALS